MNSLQGNDVEALWRASGVKYLKYHLLNPSLERMTLVDTPGTCAVVDEHVQRTGSSGHWREPWPFEPEGYKEWNKVERLFGKVKQLQHVAPRDEKLKETFLGIIQLVLGFICLKDSINVNAVWTGWRGVGSPARPPRTQLA